MSAVRNESSLLGFEMAAWIDTNHPRFCRLTPLVAHLLDALLQVEKLQGFTIESRTKAPKNIEEKIIRKGYINLDEELMDISGIRVIVDIESKVKNVSHLLHQTFDVDLSNSGNKDDLLGVDKIGYRSEHYICRLKDDRSKLREFQDCYNLCFEIQIRTRLQHTWAAIAHDRDYKLTWVLPPKIRRSLFLYAGLLEIADRGLSEVIQEIEVYEKLLAKGDLETFGVKELNAISLAEFVKFWSLKYSVPVRPPVIEEMDECAKAVEELVDFGIRTFDDLFKIIPVNYAVAGMACKYTTSLLGMVRDWMILADYKKYISKAWKGDWYNFSQDGADLKLYEKLSSEEIVSDIIDAFGNLFKSRIESLPKN